MISKESNKNIKKSNKTSKIQTILLTVISFLMFAQTIGCASTVTQRPVHSKEEILREEGIQLDLVRKKLMLR